VTLAFILAQGDLKVMFCCVSSRLRRSLEGNVEAAVATPVIEEM
jgi:hypothetical protein